MNHPMGPLQLADLYALALCVASVYLLTFFAMINETCSALGWIHASPSSKPYMKVRETQNTGLAFCSREWSTLNGMEGKMGKDSMSTMFRSFYIYCNGHSDSSQHILLPDKTFPCPFFQTWHKRVQ
jgi:hypothetical protein